MKKILCIIVALAMLASGIAYAGAIAQGTITASTTATAITSPDTDAKRAMFTCEGGSVYFGIYTTPTITTGHLLYVGDVLFLDNYRDIAAVKFILTSAGSASTTTYVRYTLFD